MAATAVAFKEWAIAESLQTTNSIENLRDSRLGIDGDDYVHSLLYIGRPEPLLSALGGLPFSLYKRIDEDLQAFREAGIEPMFVFNGLDLKCKDRSSVLREARKAENTLKAAWSVYDEGNGEEAVKAFGRVALYRSEHIIRNVQAHLQRQKVYSQTAPYSAAAQLVYMERIKFVDGIVGSASCLLFGTEKVITSLNLSKPPTFSWVGMSSCLSKLALTREQFVHVCLLSGCSILPTFPEIDADSPATRLPAARNLLSRVGFDEHNLFRDPKDEHYRDLFDKARAALRWPVIMLEDGRVEQSNPETSPHDVHEFTGQRLPEELYGYLSYNIVGPRVLNWRTRMEILETPPLDGGESDAYKKVVSEKLRPLRARALALVTALLHRYYQKNEVNLLCWWNEGNRTALGIADEAEPSKAGDSWHVKTESLPSIFHATSTPFVYAITSLANDADAKKTVTPRPAGTNPTLRAPKDLLANPIWRFLEDRGYINADHTLSGWGKALKASFDRAATSGLMARGVTETEIEEAIFMAFELLRLDVLNTTLMFPYPPYAGFPMRGSESDKGHNMLISRVACLAAFHHAAIGYTGPLSRHLLAYHQLTASVRGALRDLIEMHTCNMFLSGCADRTLEKPVYRDLGASLPFINEPDIGLALVVKSHLDEQCRPANEKPTDVTKWFNHAQDIQGDLEKAWGLWDAVNTGVQAAEEGIMAADVKKMFKDADLWLAQKRAPAHGPNGTA